MTPEELATRFDDLLREVRRQGKAAIAAQASADACLEAIGALSPEARDDEVDGVSSGTAAVVRSLIPVADALERIVAAARSGSPEPRASLRERLFGRPARDQPLLEPLCLLRSQLESAFEAAGVRIDRRVGVTVEGDAHRVVETRNGLARGGDPIVVAVVRPGYSLGGLRIREADVIAQVSASAGEGRKGRTS